MFSVLLWYIEFGEIEISAVSLFKSADQGASAFLGVKGEVQILDVLEYGYSCLAG